MRTVIPFLLTAIVTTISGCATTPLAEDIPLTDAYCGRFFIYNMCAVDYTDNGVVDAVHFEDTNEVFLYREEARKAVKNTRPLHICAQIIDKELGDVANKLLTINDDTGYLRVAAIKSDLMISYMRYTGRVNRCNKEHDLIDDDPNKEDDFHDFADDEYDDYAGTLKDDDVKN